MTKFYGGGENEFVADRHQHWQENRDASSSTLTTAKQRLESMHFVGIHERMEESIELVAHSLCWDSGRLFWAGSDAAPPNQDSIDEPTKKFITDHTRLDQLLYKHANSLLEDRYARTVEDRSSKPEVLCRMKATCQVTCQ